jgi:PAS domain S-box-containing protein
MRVARDLAQWREDDAAQLMRTLEEKLGAGTWVRRCDTLRFEWSPGFYKLLGLVPDSVEPDFALVDNMTHPDDRRSVDDLYRASLESGAVYREFRVIRPDGRVRWLSSQSEMFHSADGKPDRVEAVVIDISTLQESRRAKRYVEQRFRALSRICNGIVFQAHEDGELLDATNIAPEVAVPSDQYVGHAWHQFIHPDDLWKVLEKKEAARSTRSMFEAEHRTRMPDGTYRWRLTRAAPVMNPDQSIAEYIGLSIDIDGRKKHQEAKLAAAAPLAITGAQIRAARGILNWSVRDLSVASEVSVAIIRRYEENDGPAQCSDGTCFVIRAAMEKAGVEFFVQPDHKPGVRPR